MIFFVTCLRALAACLITNAHYTGIYPSDIIANGGLLGDVLFFAVSGYCLYHVKESFPRWYARRLIRCYLPVLLITALYALLGFYEVSAEGAVWWFLYPTFYHFVASIVILYVPYYVIVRVPVLREHLAAIMAGLAAVALVVYLVWYDKSYYHIDTVREPMIRFLFMESMLLGALFRQKDERVRDRFRPIYPILAALFFAAYFASKTAFSRYEELAELQILNWVALFVLLALLFRTFAGLDGKLGRMPAPVRKIISYLASITLEIYVVQSVLIALIRPLGHFPLNWLAVTAAILLAAATLHFGCNLILKPIESFIRGKGKSHR